MILTVSDHFLDNHFENGHFLKVSTCIKLLSLANITLPTTTCGNSYSLTQGGEHKTV